MSPQFLASLQRSGILFVIALCGIGQAYALGGFSDREAIAAVLGALGACGGRLLEGGYDTIRQINGNVKPSDVTGKQEGK